jgi:acyl carrier protein
MKRADIVAGLKELLTRQEHIKVDVNAINEDTRLTQVGFDSISILDFMYDVENRFNVQIEISGLARMERVKDLIDYLESRAVG